MFREMRRSKQQVTEEACKKVLREGRRGVLSMTGDDGYPYGIPLNFYYDETDGKLYFHGAGAGYKIDNLKNCNKVCFTTWDEGYKKEDDWALYVTSVIAFGRIELVEDRALTEEKARLIGNKYYPTHEEVEELIGRSINRVQLLSMTIDHMTGKLVHEK